MGKHVASDAHFRLSDHIWAAVESSPTDSALANLYWEECIALARVLTSAGFVYAHQPYKRRRAS